MAEKKIWTINGVSDEARIRIKAEAVRRGITIPELIEILSKQFKA